MSAPGRPSHRTVYLLRFQCFCWNRRQSVGSSARRTEAEKSWSPASQETVVPTRCRGLTCAEDGRVQDQASTKSPTDQSDHSECRCKKLFCWSKSINNINAASVCRRHVNLWGEQICVGSLSWETWSHLFDTGSSCSEEELPRTRTCSSWFLMLNKKLKPFLSLLWPFQILLWVEAASCSIDTDATLNTVQVSCCAYLMRALLHSRPVVYLQPCVRYRWGVHCKLDVLLLWV